MIGYGTEHFGLWGQFSRLIYIVQTALDGFIERSISLIRILLISTNCIYIKTYTSYTWNYKKEMVLYLKLISIFN